jgi:hypothetical protein
MLRKLDLCVAVMAALAFNVSAGERDACSLRGTAGTYIVRCEGFQITPEGASVPVAALILENRGKGGQSSGAGTISLGGLVAPIEIKNAEPVKVNADCTGTEHYSQAVAGTPAPDAHFNFIVDAKAGQIHAILSDQGYAFACTDTRISGDDDQDHD